MDDVSCNNCIWGLLKDVGWSNWTVEGTMFYCRQRNRPPTSHETYETLEKPDDCRDWRWGNPPHLHVDDKLPPDLR
jgi:hypothetical protein